MNVIGDFLYFFQIIIQVFRMDSSDEDFLPDPERFRKRKEPPDREEASGSGMNPDEPANQQSGLYLHDDYSKGKCSFFI